MPTIRDHSIAQRELLTLLLRVKNEAKETPLSTLDRAIEDLKIKMDEEDVQRVEEVLSKSMVL
ncbi:MAG: hypothetical protein FWG63_02200 [Defluviitaleaceae bacterium]|nr:hypothetical protein [Defluviitaleaceae bacterium]